MTGLGYHGQDLPRAGSYRESCVIAYLPSSEYLRSHGKIPEGGVRTGTDANLIHPRPCEFPEWDNVSRGMGTGRHRLDTAQIEFDLP